MRFTTPATPGRFLAFGAMAMLVGASARAGTLTTFSAPHAGAGENMGTRAMSINQSGVIAGWFDNEKGIYGFVRAVDGTITEFDAGAPNSTYAMAINDAGTIRGYALNSGFVRAANGIITSFSSPAGASYPIAGLGINNAGYVTGYWIDPQKVAHGFIRTPEGTLTSFEVPGQNVGTVPAAINASGVVTGSWSSSTGAGGGFIRFADGTFTTFAAHQNPATSPLSINASGAVAGYWQDVNGLNHAFVRAADGTLTTFSPSDTSGVSYCINAAGATTGYINTAGFLRMPGGSVSFFDVGCDAPTPTSINIANVMARAEKEAGGL